ncbi:MAG TPA: oligosaccharide flippase family protein [Steroidobacteraceae bacterium]|nr:oligosaccharide flippase family protein [Steroidobacteraceae bacterium]
MRITKLVNIKGDLFATGASFVGQTVIKLGSSLILTRILTPKDYGTLAILLSVVFIISLLSDIGFSISIVRSENGDRQEYLNTAWTIRIGRAFVNAAVLFLAAPIVASLYHAAALTAPLRVIAVWFVIDGFESTAFPLAVRRKNSRVLMYTDVAGTFAASALTIVYCYYSRDFWGMVYGTLFGRGVVVLISHCFYRELKPRLQWDKASAREIFHLSRYIMPSSMVTIFLNQYDKAVFLRMFDFNLLGVYSLATNIAGPVESVITKASRMVLYPRCAHNFRLDKASFSLKYYLENARLFVAILAIPAAVGGAAHLLITVLYDPRYAGAAMVLQAFMVRAAILALASPAEDMLVATGESRLILVGNIYRALWMVGASSLGYLLFGFAGFTYGIALSTLPALVYYLWLQRKKGLLIARYEMYKVAFTCAIALSAYLGSSALMALWHPGRFRL